MGDNTPVFVDYVILSPFGKLRRRAGPFDTRTEADRFIAGMKEQHHQALLEIGIRDGAAQFQL